MSKMTVIQLLNKIANGEIDRNNKYQFSRDDYCTINDFFARYIVDEENLNLEIIEEDNKIKYVGKEYDLTSFWKDYSEPAILLGDMANKIKELIDEVNKLKEK